MAADRALETLGVKPQNVYIVASEGPGDPARPAAESGNAKSRTLE